MPSPNFDCHDPPPTVLTLAVFTPQFAVFQRQAEQQEAVRAESQGGATVGPRVHIHPNAYTARYLASQTVPSHHTAPVTADMDGTEQGTT